MTLSDRPAGTVRRIELSERLSPCFDGAEFADAGAYERLHGVAHCSIDPEHRLNAGIVNLKRVPRNAQGGVDYRFDFCILKPLEVARGNGWLFYEVLNRGSIRCLDRINHATNTNRPQTAGDAGNGFLMRRGFCVVWSGWQTDLSAEDGRMRAYFPVARDGDRAITALCREEFINESGGATFVGNLSYPAIDLDPGRATLTVRQREREARQTPQDLRWKYIDRNRIEIMRPAGFDGGAIYEFIYTGSEPTVTGIAYASMRDFVSFLRHEPHDAEGNPNPLRSGDRQHMRRALGFGLSQSGRTLRDFLYLGFNEDARGGKVFDAAVPVIAGSRRSFINFPFAQPGRYSRQHEDHAYPDDQFPFTYPVLSDPTRGRNDGILQRCMRTNTCPKLMHLDTDSEIWSARASLVATDTSGNDIAMPDEVRLYLAAGLQHGWAVAPDPGASQLRDNPISYGSILRALLSAMLEWVDDGIEPPPSCFPSRAAGTLVNSDRGSSGFPSIPGVAYTGLKNELRLMNYAYQPPREGAAYPVYVVKFGPDGNSLDGIRHPLLSAALATHTGWNLRARGHAEGELFGVIGSMIPFARDARSRDPGDSRLSLEERYGSHAEWIKQLAHAAHSLVASRYFLAEDAKRLIAAAGSSWDEASAVFTAV